MANYTNLKDLFTAIANAIRSKTGSDEPIVADNFPTAIEAITGGGEVGDDYVAIAPTNTIKTYSDAWVGGIANNAFENFTELETVNAENVSFVGKSAFSGCSKLQSIQLGNLREIGNKAFLNCINMRDCTLRFDDWNTCVCDSNAFKGCTNLEKIDFGLFYGTFGSNCFSDCHNLKAIIFRSEDGFFDGMWGIPFNDSTITSGTGYIYVPSKMLVTYQEDYPDYANQFRALEDYTVDGTIGGELDETKI